MEKQIELIESRKKVLSDAAAEYQVKLQRIIGGIAELDLLIKNLTEMPNVAEKVVRLKEKRPRTVEEDE
ncbi:hypothetical protein KAR91_77495 [Candidatus Pacearchaeota archaeon]|nr:hypothetical protein [Candidatus Pacearchaeota archaeon]